MSARVSAANSDSLVSVKLDAHTDTALTKIAEKLGTSKAKLLSQAAADLVSYHRWKDKAVAAGFASGARHGWLSTEDVKRDFARRRAAHARRQEKAA